jgi:hypothetical protein
VDDPVDASDNTSGSGGISLADIVSDLVKVRERFLAKYDGSSAQYTESREKLSHLVRIGVPGIGEAPSYLGTLLV